jgi:hypothetical protein
LKFGRLKEPCPLPWLDANPLNYGLVPLLPSLNLPLSIGDVTTAA